METMGSHRQRAATGTVTVGLHVTATTMGRLHQRGKGGHAPWTEMGLQRSLSSLVTGTATVASRATATPGTHPRWWLFPVQGTRSRGNSAALCSTVRRGFGGDMLIRWHIPSDTHPLSSPLLPLDHDHYSTRLCASAHCVCSASPTLAPIPPLARNELPRRDERNYSPYSPEISREDQTSGLFTTLVIAPRSCAFQGTYHLILVFHWHLADDGDRPPCSLHPHPARAVAAAPTHSIARCVAACHCRRTGQCECHLFLAVDYSIR